MFENINHVWTKNNFLTMKSFFLFKGTSSIKGQRTFMILHQNILINFFKEFLVFINLTKRRESTIIRLKARICDLRKGLFLELFYEPAILL